MIRLVCPKCGEPDGLWTVCSFEGWISVDATYDGNRRSLVEARHGTPYYEVSNVAFDLDKHEMGCSCGWEGGVDDLIQLGNDGEPLDKPIPGQETMC